MLKAAAKLMLEATQTADGITSAIRRSAASGEFLIFPTAKSAVVGGGNDTFPASTSRTEETDVATDNANKRRDQTPPYVPDCYVA